MVWETIEKTLFVFMGIWLILFVWLLEIWLLQVASTSGVLYTVVRVLNQRNIHKDLLLHNYRTMYERLLKDYYKLKTDKLGGK